MCQLEIIQQEIAIELILSNKAFSHKNFISSQLLWKLFHKEKIVS